VRPASNGASGTTTPRQGFSRPPTPSGPVEDEYEAMSIDEIMNGQSKEEGFPGLIPLVESYLDSVNVDVETRCELARYLDFIRGRASGALWTGARWIRHFVRQHEDYKRDSVVSELINYDLIKTVERITKGEGTSMGLGREMLGDRSQAADGCLGC
jgi:glutamate--cysteine ligase catalytic subunit